MATKQNVVWKTSQIYFLFCSLTAKRRWNKNLHLLNRLRNFFWNNWAASFYPFCAPYELSISNLADPRTNAPYILKVSTLKPCIVFLWSKFHSKNVRNLIYNGTPLNPLLPCLVFLRGLEEKSVHCRVIAANKI